MYPIRSSERQEKDQHSLDPSRENHPSKGLNRSGEIYNDGMMRITIVPVSSNMRDEVNKVLEHAEPLPEYTSDAIDRGEFGALYHPVTGQSLSSLSPVRDPAFGYFVFVEKTSETTGWGGGDAPREKRLPRIGDGVKHSASDFPLRPRWKYDYKTGVRLPE